MSNALRLSDLLAAHVSIEWFEAVAIVTEIGGQIAGAEQEAVPELDQVQLNADGSITLAGLTETDEPIRRLGQLLQACLVQADPPVQLRLEVEQATAPEPSFSSIQEYCNALAYFERPDRSSVLRTLYLRAQFTHGSARQDTLTIDSIAPLPLRERKNDRLPETRSILAARKPIVAAIAAVALLALAATAYSSLRADRSAAADVAQLALEASDAVGTTVVKGISAVSEQVGLGRLVPAETPVEAKAASVPVPVSPGKVNGRARAAAPTTVTPETLRVFDLGDQAPSEAKGVVISGVRDSPSSDSTSAGAGGQGDARIYSALDAAVSAPIGVRPQLPRVVPNDVQKDQLGQIELIILPDGTVGSVKLLGGRKGVLEGMLLSAAKNWTFVPAVKDGRPVAYRKIVWLALY